MSIHQQISHIIDTNPKQIEDWFRKRYSDHRPLFYTSVDVRDSGHKIVPVDTNIFPAGFNNISTKVFKRASELMGEFLNTFPKSANILIIQENIDRNPFYAKNVEVIHFLIEKTSRKVEIGKIGELQKAGNRIGLENGFTPDIIILNHDLTSGIPEILKDCEQPIIPDPRFGWYNRKKSKHFLLYNEMVEDFCREFKLNKFFLSAEFYECSLVDFLNKKGLGCVANKVDKMMASLNQEYSKYGIEDTPYAFVKADKGTYGMGIMTLSSGEELYSMNRALRKQMGVIKSGIKNNCVLIQEGIKTVNSYNGNTAENMIYLVDGEVIDSILRVHTERTQLESLNRQGAQFFSTADLDSNDYSRKIKCYNLVARLASLAASLE